MSQAYGPLQGVKVVSCSTAQAGTVPYMLMADLGADVIKIEVPEGGDGSRRMTVLPGMPSTFFETNNRGVKSVTLNLKAPEGRAILHKLVAKADIFGQNFRPGAAEKNGFGWEELRKINPKLVYVSISGYGTKGPNGHLPGTDSMAQALGGIAEAYSMPGQKMRTGIASVADESTAMLAFGASPAFADSSSSFVGTLTSPEDFFSTTITVTASEEESARGSDVIGRPPGRDSRLPSRGESHAQVGLGCELRALDHGIDRIAHHDPGRRTDGRQGIGQRPLAARVTHGAIVFPRDSRPARPRIASCMAGFADRRISRAAIPC